MANPTISDRHYLVPTYPFRGLEFSHGQDQYLVDTGGSRYLDLMTNYGVDIFGHGHPKLVQAIRHQIDQLATLHGSFSSQVRAQAAQLLVKKCGPGLSRVYFSNSGTEAVEAALKFALLATNKSQLIAMDNSYHGKTLGSLGVTGTKKYRQRLERMLGDTAFIPYGNADQLEHQLEVNADVAAVILEPIQGESGIHVPPTGFLERVAELCRQHQVLLIADEIQTGLGRTGTFLASQHHGITPDILCLGKGLAGGVPAGATLVNRQISAAVPKASHTSTLGGNPLACRGMIATLELLTDQTIERVAQLGEYLITQLNALDQPRVTDVRGRGLMIGIEVTGNLNQVLKAMQSEGVLASPAGDNVVRFLPPYTVTREQLDLAVGVLTKALDDQAG